jgi:hypothetical protein
MRGSRTKTSISCWPLGIETQDHLEAMMAARMAVIEKTFYETRKMLQKSKNPPALRKNAQAAAGSDRGYP